MNLGVQYYRAPFPARRYWRDDFARIRKTGLDTVQLWILWGWVEARPGEFVFDDYDELIDLAARHDLNVVLSTIAEIQPYWIHREVPDSAMVDHMGRAVISSNRQECHHGLTPGGCTDHPGVWNRMRGFLEQVAGRYAGLKHLHGWDAWNELRWNVNADGLVCFCPHTLAAFRRWLEVRHGSLDGLNRAWQRRYDRWDDVLPGKLPGRTYTEMMAFEHFITCRANEHAWARYETIRAIDRKHPITVHGGHPTPLCCGGWNAEGSSDHALNRGNDWFFADRLDGIGCSSFPKWFGIDDADFGMRVEFVRSAARGKRVWLSEIQGGRGAIGNRIFAPVDARSQQRWIWNGLACGADTLLFWCWRDEVFGKESSGFGLTGDDGLADERLAALRRTSSVLKKHESLVRRYQPVKPDVGVLFSPQSYYRDWASEGEAVKPYNALRGYLRALVRNCIPYTVIEEEHLDQLDGLKILFLPRALVVDDATARVLSRFVRNGGTLICESECGAFDSKGLYRYPEDRFTTKLARIREIGRRNLDTETFRATLGDGAEIELGACQWFTPWEATRGYSLATAADGSLISVVPCGKGCMVLCGTFLGEAYINKRTDGFERFVAEMVAVAGCRPDVSVVSPKPSESAFVYIKHGFSGGKRVVFVFFPPGGEPVRLRFRGGFFKGRSVVDIVNKRRVPLTRGPRGGQTCELVPPALGIAVLVGS